MAESQRQISPRQWASTTSPGRQYVNHVHPNVDNEELRNRISPRSPRSAWGGTTLVNAPTSPRSVSPRGGNPSPRMNEDPAYRLPMPEAHSNGWSSRDDRTPSLSPLNLDSPSSSDDMETDMDHVEQSPRRLPPFQEFLSGMGRIPMEN